MRPRLHCGCLATVVAGGVAKQLIYVPECKYEGSKNVVAIRPDQADQEDMLGSPPHRVIDIVQQTWVKSNPLLFVC